LGAIGFSNVKPGGHCVVVGASGAIGMMILQYLKRQPPFRSKLKPSGLLWRDL